MKKLFTLIFIAMFICSVLITAVANSGHVNIINPGFLSQKHPLDERVLTIFNLEKFGLKFLIGIAILVGLIFLISRLFKNRGKT